MVGAVVECLIDCPPTPLASSCFSYCLATSSHDRGALIMAQPFERSPSSPPFPNTSQSLQPGNTPFYNFPESNYPPLDQGLDHFPVPQFSEAWELGLLPGDPEPWDLSSLFCSGEDSSLPLGSSQTSHTDPSWEPCPQTANPIQSQNVPVDPRLESNALDPPTTQASAESVNDLVFQTQTEPRQHVSEVSITEQKVVS